jgi:hypothetical protein
MRQRGIFEDGFSARIKSVEALLQAGDPRAARPEALRRCASELDGQAPEFEHTATAVAYSAFAELLRICALIVEWRAAVLEAGPDADRFIRGAKERRKLWLAEFHDKPAAIALIVRSQEIEGLTVIGDVAQVLATIAATPLPVGLVRAEHRFRVQTSEDPNSEIVADKPTVKSACDLAVAFLKFTLNGAPAEKTHFLSPGQIHDLEIEVRVSRWPDAAEYLSFAP